MAEPVTTYSAIIPVTGDVYGDISRSIIEVASALTKKGYNAQAAATGAKTGYWTGATYFTTMTVTVRKAGKPFDPAVAQADVQAAASSIGLKLGVLKDWVISVGRVSADAYTPSTYAKAGEKTVIAGGKLVEEGKDVLKTAAFGGGAILGLAALVAGAFVIFQFRAGGRAAKSAFSGLGDDSDGLDGLACMPLGSCHLPRRRR